MIPTIEDRFSHVKDAIALLQVGLVDNVRRCAGLEEEQLIDALRSQVAVASEHLHWIYQAIDRGDFLSRPAPDDDELREINGLKMARGAR